MIEANWCRSCGGGSNFGDQLTPLLLGAWGIAHRWAPPGTAEFFGVGSIISKVPRPGPFRGTIWGSGTIRQGVGRDLRAARVLAVRGELTAAECRLGRRRVTLGDPGILAPDLLGAEAAAVRPGSLGTVIVPHYVDHGIARRHLGAAVVPITGSPLDVLVGIASAVRVFTSSLHGAITADALGVPHVVELHPDVIGGAWKFRDYLTAFGEPFRPGVERLTPRPAMAELQATHRAILDRLAEESP